MSITLYTTHCPRCKVLASKLSDKNIVYEEVTDENVMINKGFMSVPVLVVGDEEMDFTTAIQWINNQ